MKRLSLLYLSRRIISLEGIFASNIPSRSCLSEINCTVCVGVWISGLLVSASAGNSEMHAQVLSCRPLTPT